MYSGPIGNESERKVCTNAVSCLQILLRGVKCLLWQSLISDTSRNIVDLLYSYIGLLNIPNVVGFISGYTLATSFLDVTLSLTLTGQGEEGD